MGMYILIGLTLFFLALLLMTEYIGRNFWRFAPKEHLKQGGKIHVYINGKIDTQPLRACPIIRLVSMVRWYCPLITGVLSMPLAKIP